MPVRRADPDPETRPLTAADHSEFDPTYKAVAKSWSKLPADKRQDVFFAQLDFPNGQAVYQRLGLQTAPTMQFWPATAGEHASKGTKANYEFQRMWVVPRDCRATTS